MGRFYLFLNSEKEIKDIFQAQFENYYFKISQLVEILLNLSETLCNNIDFYLYFTVDNQKNFVTEVSSPSFDTHSGERCYKVTPQAGNNCQVSSALFSSDY